MGNFKNFLLNEEINLGNIGEKIQKFISNNHISNQINGTFLSSQMSNSYTHANWRGNDNVNNAKEPIDLILPSVVRSGRIIELQKTKNPIQIRISDGTICSLTYDQFRKINPIPREGNHISVIFQRNSEDDSDNFSKIQKIIVTD